MTKAMFPTRNPGIEYFTGLIHIIFDVSKLWNAAANAVGKLNMPAKSSRTTLASEDTSTSVSRIEEEPDSSSKGLRFARIIPDIPTYLRETYSWAYLHPFGMAFFDRSPIVSAILWGNYGRLKRAASADISPGARVLQAACVYGDFSIHLAEQVGNMGMLDVIDIVPMQVENCARKLRDYQWSNVRLADAAMPGEAEYDVVCCFFLLHELPEEAKGAVVNALLTRVRPGGKVVFVDYHKPHPLHPLRPVTSLIFRLLEPFAKELWSRDIRTWAEGDGDFHWNKETCFGGLFQKVTAKHRSQVNGEVAFLKDDF